MTTFYIHRIGSSCRHIGIVTLLVLSFLAAAILSTGCGKDDNSRQKAQTGTTAAKPQAQRFVLKNVYNKHYEWSQFVGKPFMINFWATWCGPCHREMPVLKKIYGDYHPKGLEIVAISVDDDRTKAQVIPFVDRYRVPWVVLYGTEQVMREFNLGPSIPTTIFFDAQGNETGRIVGAQSELAFRQQLDKLFP